MTERINETENFLSNIKNIRIKYNLTKIQMAKKLNISIFAIKIIKSQPLIASVIKITKN